MWKNTLICVYAVVCLAQENDYKKLVHIEQGPVRGYQDFVTRIYAFYGIPYARVPTGPDRYKVTTE